MALAAAGRAGDQHIQPIGRIRNCCHGYAQLVFQTSVRTDQSRKRPVLLRVASHARFCLRFGRHILRGRLLRCGFLRFLRRYGEKAYVFLAFPAQFSLRDELVQLNGSIVAPDPQRIRDHLRCHALYIRRLCRGKNKL